MLDKLWDTLVRWRVWIVNTALSAMFILPELLNSPEVLAVIPAEYQRWFLVAAFLVNIWMRPRPATRASDAEVKVAKTLKRTGKDAVVKVETDAGTEAVFHA